MTLAWSSLLVVAASLIAGIVSYLFNPLLIAPKLGAEGIAILGAALSLYSAFTFPHRPIALTVIRYISHYQALNKPGTAATVITRSFRKLLIYGTPALILLCLASPAFARFLNLKTVWPVLGGLFLAYMGLFQTVALFSLQGLLRFKPFAAAFMADPVARILTGLLLLGIGLTVPGVLIAYITGFIVSLALGCWYLKDLIFYKEKGIVDRTEIYRYGIPTFFFSLYTALVLSADGLMAKHYFTDFDAGIYFAAATLSKILLAVFLPLAFTSFSHMSDAASRKADPRILFWKTLLMTTGLCAVFTSIFFMIPALIIKLTYGASFDAAIPLLGISCLALIPVVITQIYSHYCLALKRYGFLYGLLGGAVIRLALIITYHNDWYQLIYASLAGGIAEAILAIATNRKKPETI